MERERREGGRVRMVIEGLNTQEPILCDDDYVTKWF